jgi:hypothetical protein
MLGGAGSAALAGGMTGLASGTGFMAGASTALTAIPVWGWAAMAIMALLGSMDDSGTPHMGGAGAYSKATGTTLGEASEAYTGFDLTADQYMDDANKEFGSMSKSIAELLEGTSKAFGGRASYSVGTGFADDSSEDGAWGALRIVRDGKVVVDWGNGDDKWPGKEFADGEEGRAAYMTAAIAGVRDALKEETPGWADAMLDALGDAPTLDQLATTVTQINQVQAALDSLGKAMPWLADMSDEVTTSLVTEAGGIDSFTAAHQAYLQAMYSEQEQQALSQSQLAGALAEQGLQMPASIAAWRDLTEAQDRTTESGQQAYLTMIQLGPTFAAQMDAMLQDAGISADSMASVIRDGMLGRLSAEDAGGQVADMIVGGIYNAMASSASTMVTNILMQGIVQPMVQAAATGAVVSSAASQAAINATVAQAKLALAAIGAVLNDPAVQAAIADIGTQTSALFANYKAPTLPAYTPMASSSASSASSSVAAATAATNAWDKAYSALERAVEAQRQAAEEQLAAATAVYDLARANARELRNEVEANVQMDATAGRSFFESALQTLQTSGYLPDQDALGEAVTAARAGLDSKVYTSAYEYNRDRLVLAGQLQQLADLAEPQKTAAEQQLDYLEGVLNTAKAQLNFLEGIYNNDVSVSTALATWLKTIPASVRAVASMPSLPAFAVGTDYVPTDMLALIHQGEQIVPKAYNPHANGQGAGRTDDLLQVLIVEVRSLHARLAVVERHNERAALTLDDVARGRRTFKTQEVSA